MSQLEHFPFHSMFFMFWKSWYITMQCSRIMHEHQSLYILFFSFVPFYSLKWSPRKASTDQGNCIRNVAKKRRQAGKQYISTKTGRSVSERSLMAVKYCSRCRLKCSEKRFQERGGKEYTQYSVPETTKGNPIFIALIHLEGRVEMS